MKNELLILLPAYNEDQNVEQMIDAWKEQEGMVKERYGLVLQIVVINDGSKDQTESICNRLSDKYDNFTLINHPKNKGLGQAIKTALLYAIKDRPNCRFACIMDCDNTQDPKYIKDMLKKIGAASSSLKADVVIASRYQKGAKVQGLSKIRLLTSEGAKYIYSAIIPVKKVRDYTCGYRLYTIDILRRVYKRFGQAFIEETGFTCMAELLYKLYLVGARFEEIPFVLRYDFKQGQSKMKVLKTAGNSIKLAFRLRRLKKG
ncbi:MAG: glycosyltransferase family 2 protein [Anaerolineaceae bacterium]|nr:MAG: glycosyltransferase family 2 protein [Anaerolineaceae bacterium]